MPEIRAGRGRGSGWHLRWRRSHSPVRQNSALNAPTLLRRATRQSALEPGEWSAALTDLCGGFRRAQAAHGPAAASWWASQSLTNEEMAFTSVIARQCLKFPPGLSSAAPLISPTWEAPEESDVIITFDAAVTETEAPLWLRIATNRHQPRIITITPGAAEPSPGETARFAPLPGSLPALLHGLANIIIAGGWWNHGFVSERTTGFAEYAELAGHYTTDRVCAETGLSADAVWELAQAIGTGARVCFCGHPESAESSEPAVRNLALLTGQWGRAGTGLCLGREPANALGAHLFSQAGALAQHEAAAARGELHALWVIATDTDFSPAEMERWAALAARLEWLVVQGGPSSGLAQLADLYLPTAGWRAKEGTRVDPSGRLRLLKPRPQPAGGAMTDFHLGTLIAQYAGCSRAFSRWSSPESAFQILKQSTRGASPDFSKVADYAEIDAYRAVDEGEVLEGGKLPFLLP